MRKFLFIFFAFILSTTLINAQQWVARYNGSGNGMDEIKSMVVDNSGNVYVSHYSFSAANDNDYMTIKYNTNSNDRVKLAIYNADGRLLKVAAEGDLKMAV